MTTFLVFEPGRGCYEYAHELESDGDNLTVCLACQKVAARALADGLDPYDAVRLFRSWDPDEEKEAT